MKNLIKSLLLIQSVFLGGCTDSRITSSVTLDIINFDLQKSHSIIIYDMISSEEEVYLPDTINRNNLRFQIPVTSSKLAALKIGDKYSPILLEPGFDMTLTIKDSSNSRKYSGVGSEINNRMTMLNSIVYEYFLPDLIELDANDFLAKMDVIQLKADSINRLTQTKNLNDLGMQLFETILTSYKLNYLLANYNLFNKDTKLPVELSEVLNQVLEYPELIEIGSINHSVSLNMYLSAAIHPKLWDTSNSGIDSLRMVFPSIVDGYLQDLSIDGQLKEILRAKNIYWFLSHFGANSITTMIYDQFKSEYNESEYLPTLEAKYTELTSLAKGSRVPNIAMKTITGETISLRDLTGKVIYLDIWATWCKPCIEEFPFLSTLREKFSDEDVQFVNLSIDKDEKKWMNYLAAENGPDNLHFIEKEKGSVFAAFHMNSIPRYVLIDRDGKIIDANAPKPSSNRIESLIIENL